jgi:hypothetical protein
LKRKWFPKTFKACHDFALASHVPFSIAHMPFGGFEMLPEHAAGSFASAFTFGRIE